MKRTMLLAAALCMVSATAALAQSDLGFHRFGVAAGYVSPDGLDGTFSVGVFADHGMLTPRIGLESRLDYWGQSEEAFGAEAKFRDIALGARGKYYFEISHPTIRPFAGAGLSLHFVHAEVTVTQPGFPTMSAEDSSTELGIDLGGGMSMPVNPKTDFNAELWYVVGDVDHLMLRVGMSWKLGS